MVIYASTSARNNPLPPEKKETLAYVAVIPFPQGSPTYGVIPRPGREGRPLGGTKIAILFFIHALFTIAIA